MTLAFDDRHRRRITLTSDQGEPFLLDLPEASVLEEGDGLAMSDGTWLRVRAAAETLIEVTAPTPEQLARLAWHLGNRHLPVQIDAEALLIREDAVIADMLRGLGATVRVIAAPFSPERGAYDDSRGYDHSHRRDDHGHGHDHDHHHEHGHDHEH